MIFKLLNSFTNCFISLSVSPSTILHFPPSLLATCLKNSAVCKSFKNYFTLKSHYKQVALLAERIVNHINWVLDLCHNSRKPELQHHLLEQFLLLCIDETQRPLYSLQMNSKQLGLHSILLYTYLTHIEIQSFRLTHYTNLYRVNTDNFNHLQLVFFKYNYTQASKEM